MALEAVPRVDHTNPHSTTPTQNLTPHWPAGQFGGAMGTVQCIMVHETSGTPSYAGNETFMGRYSCTVNQDRGIGPQYFIEPNGTAFTLIGDQDLAGLHVRPGMGAGPPSTSI